MTEVMIEDDIPAEVVSQEVDFFDTDETYDVFLVNPKTGRTTDQYVTCKIFNEGDRRKWQSAGTKDVRVDKVKGDAYFKVNTPEERKALLDIAIVDWNLRSRRKGEDGLTPIPFNPANKTKFLTETSPSVIDQIEKEIRKHEPWLMDNMKVEDIDRQIMDLQELKEDLVRREAGKGTS